MLMAMKTNGGVVQVVALGAYVKSDPVERAPALNGAPQGVRNAREPRAAGGHRVSRSRRTRRRPRPPVPLPA